MVSGASLLRRRPLLSACSKRFGSRRPCKASASRGESGGGASPARGLGRSARERLLMLALARLATLALLLGASWEKERSPRALGRSGRSTMAAGREQRAAG